MDASDYGRLEQRLRERGWTRDAAGGWSAPKRGGGMGAVEGRQPERVAAPALDGNDAQFQGGADGVGYRVAFVALRRRLLDDDNNVGSMKPLRDAVAATLGLDDGDGRVAWEYGQARTDGEEGVLVKVETG